MEQLVSHWREFRDILYLNIFRKICPENADFIKIYALVGYLAAYSGNSLQTFRDNLTVFNGQEIVLAFDGHANTAGCYR
jgi:hypothetical protein